MTSGKKIYKPIHIASSIIMLMALAWLTVCTPFVYKSQQAQKEKIEKIQLADNGDEDNSNPLTNTNEEKSENSTNTLSEYLHDVHVHELYSSIIIKYYKGQPHDLYLAYHPEMIVPPPNFSLS